MAVNHVRHSVRVGADTLGRTIKRILQVTKLNTGDPGSRDQSPRRPRRSAQPYAPHPQRRKISPLPQNRHIRISSRSCAPNPSQPYPNNAEPQYDPQGIAATPVSRAILADSKNVMWSSSIPLRILMVSGISLRDASFTAVCTIAVNRSVFQGRAAPPPRASHLREPGNQSSSQCGRPGPFNDHAHSLYRH